jgi:2',3'-cyclic-nucleotide 2'-phosphodiesterase (5'-nucleotidase family)
VKHSKHLVSAVIVSTLLFSLPAPLFAHSDGASLAQDPQFVGSTYEKANHPLAQTTFSIIHDTHFHGNFGDPKAPNNIANYFGIANKIKAAQPNSIFVGNGDDLGTSVISSTFQGQPIVDAFNAGKLDVDTFGNHDFDMGPDQLTKLIKNSQFTWVSANVVDKRTNDVFGKEAGAKRFIIKEVNGVKIGITGLINEEAPQITTMGENAKVLNPVVAMKAIIPEMKAAGAQFIIVSSHLTSPDARVVAKEVDGIDLIVGDHAAFAFDSPEKVNNTMLWFIGDEFTYLGEINFNFKDGKIADFNYHRYALKTDVAKEGITPDPNVKAVMDKYNGMLAQELNVQIGSTTTELDVMKASQRKMETAMGNLVADAMKDYTKADVAMINGGGIRAERIFPVGPLTKKDIMDALPFTNYVTKIEVTGNQLYQALENGVSQIEDNAGRYPQVSGIQYTYNPKLIPGARVVDVTVNGKKLDPKAIYSLAVVDFMAGGGDGYDVLKNAKVLLDKNAGPLLSKVVTDYIAQKQTVSPKTEGRIQIVDKTPGNLYTNFNPGAPITRAEFQKLLSAAANISLDLSGTNEKLYRDEMAKWVIKALEAKGKQFDATSDVTMTLKTFQDQNSLNDEMKANFAKAAYLGIIHGKKDGKGLWLAPSDPVTRVQAAVIIERMLAIK